MENHREVPLLETERLTLRRLELQDSERVVLLAGVKEVATMTLHIPHPYPAEEAEIFIRGTHLAVEKGEGYVFAITGRGETELIGCIGLGLTPDHLRGEVGYWIGVPYWGQGYATEAVRAVLRFGFETLGLNKITSSYFLNNPASYRVQQKAGMTREGVLLQHYLKSGQFLDLGVCGILRTEYENGKDFSGE